MELKLLFVCSNDFPYSGACASLIKKLTLQPEFADAAEIHVLSLRHDFDEPATEVYHGITVHRTRWCGAAHMPGLVKHIRQYPFPAIQGIFYKFANKLRAKSPQRSFIDPWIERAISCRLESLADEQFDAVIPIAGYYECVSAVMKHAKKCSTRTIVYQVDPCATNWVGTAKMKQERLAFERRMYEESSAVITTPILLREMQSILPNALLKKATAMEFPNVNPHHQESSDIAKTDTKCYTCVFAGAVYRQARNPAYTFRLFSALKDKQIALHMIGVQEKQVAEFIGDEELPENIKFFGTMPLEQAQQHMAEADVLINIGNIMTNQVPSKIFEYISSGKPIVNICTSHECPTLPYLEKYPYVLNLFECDPNFDEQVQQLEAFIRENAGKRVSADYIMRTYETCTAQYCAKQMLDIIKQVLRDE